MNELRHTNVSRGFGRGLARVGIIAVTAATVGSMGVASAFAQESDNIYGGGMATGSDVAGESVPVAEDAASAPSPEVPAIEVPVPGAVNAVMGGEELPAPVDLGVLDDDESTPVDLSVVGEGMPLPVDIDAIFASLNLPVPAADTEEEATVGPDISLGGTVGGDASGTITMGGGEAGDISIGGADEGSVSGG